MPLSWNDICSQATAFSREYHDATRENTETQSFYNDFFNVFGITRRVTSFTRMRKERMTKAPVVAVLYKTIPQYRRDFFTALRDRLHREGIELRVIYGQPAPSEAHKQDSVGLPWAIRTHNRFWIVRGRELTWQPVMRHLRDADLVIVEQASKLLVNYALWVQYLLGGRALAFWGHGRNFKAHGASRLGEWLKTLVSRHVHWWFAYTEGTADLVASLGVPRERITVVQNAIDTTALQGAYASMSEDTRERLRQELGLGSGPVAIYAGAMYAEKRLPFLIDACRKIHAALPDFHLVCIGAGPDEHIVRDAATSETWIHMVGPRFDLEKVPYFAVADVALMPGLVGLGVLDAFALQVPLITVDLPYHSPEIAYLAHDENGIMIPAGASAATYAQAVIAFLNDDDARVRLRGGCHRAAACYTVEAMVERFAQGVFAALRAKGRDVCES